MSARPLPERSVSVGGDIRDSILVLGDHNVVEVALGDDAILRRLLDEGQVRIARREHRTPPPPPFADRIDREPEVAALRAAVDHVNLHGTSGIGKTYVLLAGLGGGAVPAHMHASERTAGDVGADPAHIQAGERTAGDVGADPAYIHAGGRSADDVLQAIAEELLDCEPPLVLSPERRRRELRDVEAVVAVDDLAVSPQDAQRLLAEAPGCRYVVSSRRRVLAQANAIRVPGLAAEDASKLVAAELGRALSPGEETGARHLAELLGGHPLMLRQAARLAADTGASPAELADALAEEDPVRALSARLQAWLEPEDRELVLELAAAGAPLGTARLAELAGDPKSGVRLAALEARGLVRSHSPRFSLVGALAASPPSVGETRRAGLATALAEWARNAELSAVLDEARALLAVLRWAQDAGQHGLVIGLARALDRPLALGRRWWAWREALTAAHGAAAASGDAATEAWALHQLGTREFAVGSAEEAVELLERALDRRKALGDRAGTEATRHNLEFIRGAGGDPDGEGQSPDGDGPRRPGVRALLAVICAVLLLGIGAMVASAGGGPSTPPDSPAPAATAAGQASPDPAAQPTPGATEDPAAEPTAEPPAEDPGTGPAAEPSAEPPAEDPGTDPPAEDPPADPGADPPAEDPGTDPPAEDPPADPGTDPPAADPGTDPPAADPGTDPPATDSGLPDDTQEYGGVDPNPRGPIVR